MRSICLVCSRFRPASMNHVMSGMRGIRQVASSPHPNFQRGGTGNCARALVGEAAARK